MGVSCYNLHMNIVIIGNGIAAQRAVMEIFRQDARHSVTVVGMEEQGPYPRPRLPEYISGDLGRSLFESDALAAYAGRGLVRHRQRCVSIDREKRSIVLKDGTVLPYDSLVIATGAHANRLDIPGGDAVGIHTLRSLHDADCLIAAAQDCSLRPVVIGAGLLGLETAHALSVRSGREVLVIETADRLLPRQFDASSSAYLEKLLNDRNLVFSKGTAPVSFKTTDGNVSSVVMSDGTVVEADMVVEAVGVTPEKDLAEACGLAVGRGVVIDGHARTSDPNIYACGDAAQFGGLCPGLVYYANETARVAASNACGIDAVLSLPSPSAYISCAGIDAYSLGVHEGPLKRIGYEKSGRMEAVFLSGDGVLQGVVAVGSKANLAAYQKAIGHPFDSSLVSWAV